ARRHPHRLERGVDRVVERLGNPLRSSPLVLEDPPDERRGLVVLRALRYALQLFIAADLQVLEGPREGGELPGRAGMAAEEGRPVKPAEPQRGVLEPGRIAAEGVQPSLDQLGMVTGLREVLLVDALEPLAAGELR